VANSSNITVPWMVTSSLYISRPPTCMPGRASSARMTIAIRPAARKNANEVAT